LSDPPPFNLLGSPENEHCATIEALESSKSAQQEEIQRGKEEHQRLRARLQQLQKVIGVRLPGPHLELIDDCVPTTCHRRN